MGNWIMLITWDSIGTALLFAATFAIVIAIGKSIGILATVSNWTLKRMNMSDGDVKNIRKSMAPATIQAALEASIGYFILIGFVIIGLLFPGSLAGDSLSVVVLLLIASWFLMGIAYVFAKRAVGEMNSQKNEEKETVDVEKQ